MSIAKPHTYVRYIDGDEKADPCLVCGEPFAEHRDGQVMIRLRTRKEEPPPATQVKREKVGDRQITTVLNISDEKRMELLHLLTYPSRLGVTTLIVATDKYGTIITADMSSGVRVITEDCEIASRP